MLHTPGVPRDRDARPSLDAVLELRRDRMSTVRQRVGARRRSAVPLTSSIASGYS
jgi:hypothetical protein